MERSGCTSKNKVQGSLESCVGKTEGEKDKQKKEKFNSGWRRRGGGIRDLPIGGDIQRLAVEKYTNTQPDRHTHR